MKSFYIYTIAGLCIYIYAVYIMIQCTEPATPAVIACYELPVSLQEAVLGLKTLSPITVLSERASFGSCESSRSHTLEKSRSKEERPVQAIFRQTQTDVSRRTGRQAALSRRPTHWTIKFPLPNLSGRLSQDVGHRL